MVAFPQLDIAGKNFSDTQIGLEQWEMHFTQMHFDLSDSSVPTIASNCWHNMYVALAHSAPWSLANQHNIHCLLTYHGSTHAHRLECSNHSLMSKYCVNTVEHVWT